MNKLLALFALVMISSAQLHAQFQRVRGNGKVVTQERQTGSFDKVHSRGHFDVVITDGPSHKVSVEADENLQEYIIIETSGNTLEIRPKNHANIQSARSIKIHVTAPALSAVALSGSGNITSTNKLQGSDKFNLSSSGSGNIQVEIETGSLNASISGSGNMNLKGSTNQFEGKISGSGNIRAKEFQSNITTIRISGSGNAEVVANEKLDSHIAGSGDVRFWGNASVDSKIAGSGSVRRQN